MAGCARVLLEGYRSDVALRAWLARALELVATLRRPGQNGDGDERFVAVVLGALNGAMRRRVLTSCEQAYNLRLHWCQ